MALESFVISETCKVPSAIVEQLPNRPKVVKYKTFTKGEVVNGELKHLNNKPAIVLTAGGFVIPLNLVKKLITKDIKSETVSSADGTETKSEAAGAKEPVIVPVEYTNPKVQYMDGAIVGALLGFGATYAIEKKFPTWLPVDSKNKIYGALIGALAGVYFIYRKKGIKPVAPKVVSKAE